MDDNHIPHTGIGSNKPLTGLNATNKPARIQRETAVPWAGKMWADYTHEDKAGFRKHWSGLTDQQRINYAMYLHHYFGAPHRSEWGF